MPEDYVRTQNTLKRGKYMKVPYLKIQVPPNQQGLGQAVLEVQQWN
jgi:hypothetical protein